jgi:Asp-tRNA(Asn)/Glu-tRNA(Gln) amidotransferase C subunit
MPSEPITEPQMKYLRELAMQQLDEDEREEFLAELPELTKQEASLRIQQLKN